MKMMRKAAAMLLALGLLLGLAACSSAETVFISSQTDLAGKVIGVQLGTTGDTIASDDVAAKTVERFTRYVDAITALKQKKIDCIVMDRDTANEMIKANAELTQIDVGFEPEQYAIAVQKGDADLLATVNSVIKTMKEDGSLAASFAAHDGSKGSAPDLNVGASGGILKMGTESGFAPYEYIADGKVAGVDIDIMARVAKELNMELQIEDMPFDSLITALSSGKIDAIAAGMTINDERKVNVDFSDPYVDASQVVVIRKTSQK
ncbi:MAG: transporter substrate-binding domain-containing protein [Clostridiales bacterium]|nr:transporter substrate-binding domain-containing protein [Clostridiales bacterium]